MKSLELVMKKVPHYPKTAIISIFFQKNFKNEQLEKFRMLIHLG